MSLKSIDLAIDIRNSVTVPDFRDFHLMDESPRLGKHMQIIYHIMVFYLTVHFIWYMFKEKKFWNQLSAAIVLIMFLLRLLLIK